HHAVSHAYAGHARRLLPVVAFGSTAIEGATITRASAIGAAPRGGLRLATALLFWLGLVASIWGLSEIGQEFANATPDTRPAGSICSTLSAYKGSCKARPQ